MFFGFFFSDYIAKSPNALFNRRRFSKNKEQTSVKQHNTLSRIAFWGVTITVGGLAIYLWNQSQAINLGI